MKSIVCQETIGCVELPNSYMNVKFSKGHLTAPKPKSEDIEKSIGRIKKMVNMFL